MTVASRTLAIALVAGMSAVPMPASADVIVMLREKILNSAVSYSATVPDLDACRALALSASVSSKNAEPVSGGCADQKTGRLLARVSCFFDGSNPWTYDCRLEPVIAIDPRGKVVLGDVKTPGGFYGIVDSLPATTR